MTTINLYNQVLAHAKTLPDHAWVDTRHLFKNYRNGKGLSLTRLGLRVLQDMGFEFEIFKFENEVKFTAKLRILLDRYNKYPYYISRNELVLFGNEDRIMFKLYGKDLESWVEHMEENIKKD